MAPGRPHNEGRGAHRNIYDQFGWRLQISPVRLVPTRLTSPSRVPGGHDERRRRGRRCQVVQNFTLRPGNVSQTIEVSAAAPLLESQDASVGQVVDSKDVTIFHSTAGILRFSRNSPRA